MQEFSRGSFTLLEYREILSHLAFLGVTFREPTDFPHTGTSVYIRHDVDNELFLLSDMARTEAEYGVSSTYFLMTASTAYNLFSVEAARTVENLLEWGHSVGLHYMNEGAEGLNDQQIIEDILRHCDLVERISGEKLSAFSYHQPSQILLEKRLQVPGLTNMYNLQHEHGVAYTSDTNLQWRSGHPIDLIERGIERLQILVHPMWWTPEALNVFEHWERVRNSIVNNLVEHWMNRERSLSQGESMRLKVGA